jgi:CHAT domain-containing protein
VLHLGCHASAGESPEQSQLALAAGAVLPVSRILAQARHRERDAPGSLVVLAACTSDLTLTDYDEALTLTSAFLAAGAAGAVGSRWAVNDRFTALLMFMFHRQLVRSPGDGPAGALRAAQLWMLDKDRKIPPEMPGELASLAALAIRRPYAWAAFTCHGL